MDWTKIEKVFNDILKEYEKSEMFSIMLCSTDYGRDIRLLNGKVTNFKAELKKLKDQNDSKQAGDSFREEDLRKESV